MDLHGDSASLGLLLVLGLYGLVFLSIEYLQARRPIDGELARKSTHIVGGFLAAALPIALSRPQIIGLGLVMAVAMATSKRWNLFRSIHRRDRQGHGEVWFPLGIALLALIEPTNDLRYICGVLVLSLSDALASIIGLKFGKKKYYLVTGHWKTYLGSLTFFVSGLVILSLVFTNLAGLGLWSHLWLYAVISGCLTLTEAISHSGIDNVVIPLITALLLRLASLG